MKTDYKLLEEGIYINQVEHFVSFMYKDKKIQARGEYFVGSMGFDELSIEIDDAYSIDWKLNQGEISKEDYHEIRELAEDFIYELHVPYNETIHHKLYSHETKTI